MFVKNKYFYLLLHLLWCIVKGQDASNEEPVYQNLYGFTSFDTSASDPGLMEGVVNIIQLSDQFRREAQPDVTPGNLTKYDFIVVGAGSGGCVVASRLSEIEEARVLLIEAGDEESVYMDIPLTPQILQPLDSLNWKYLTEPSDKYCLGMENRQCKWPRGKVMGGSSVLNYMVATRGFKHDYDRWAELGADGWSYDEILQYFKKMETVMVPELRSNTQYRGSTGPLAISYSPFISPVATSVLKGFEDLGLPYVDYNAVESIGYSRTQSTTLHGSRLSANRAYLHSRKRKNLHVTKNSLATKILIDPQTKRAYGVKYKKDDVEYTMLAEKEIILSGGVVGTPQLLMLSGVGPADHLKELGIKVIKDSPVGKNLQDHLAYTGLTFVVDQPVTLAGVEVTKVGAPYVKDYLLNQTGPFSVSGGIEVLSFIDAFDPQNVNAVPNVELIFFGVSLSADPTLLDDFGINAELQNEMKPLLQENAWSIAPMGMKPKSRGYLKLRSADINDKPIIVPNYFEDPEDIRTLIAGINASIAFAQSKAMQRFNPTMFDINIKDCNQYKGDHDKYWECAIRHLAVPVYHHCGTCKMGRENDKTSVLDPSLKVIGIEGLRVADTSAIPEITSTHLNLVSMVIAEKASDMIKCDWYGS